MKDLKRAKRFFDYLGIEYEEYKDSESIAIFLGAQVNRCEFLFNKEGKFLEIKIVDKVE